MIDFASDIVGVVKVIGQSLTNFLDFILSLPNLFFTMLDFIPQPFNSIIIFFITFFIIILLLKVVRLVVG